MKHTKMSQKTKILTVAHDDGSTATCHFHLNALLFEIAEGPHWGKRGCDGCLFELVGPIQWDESQISSYETGHRSER